MNTQNNTICDRCQKSFDWSKDYYNNNGALYIYECRAGVGEWELDLCTECQKSLRDWIGAIE